MDPTTAPPITPADGPLLELGVEWGVLSAEREVLITRGPVEVLEVVDDGGVLRDANSTVNKIANSSRRCGTVQEQSY